MHVTASPILLLFMAHADGLDPIVACREAHRPDPPAHIACLERALQEGAREPGPIEDSPEFGASQVHPREHAAPAAVSVEIVEVVYAGDELGVFTLANGQVWKETTKTPKALRLESGRRYAARIERGRIGGYRMYVDGVRRMFTVRRMR